MELELAERGIDDLPAELEGIGGRNSGQYVNQGRNGACRSEHDNVLLALGKVEQAVQSALDPFDKAQPGFQFRGIVSATEPALDDQFENALELGRIVGGIVHRRQGLWLVRQQAGKQGIKYGVSIEFVEGSVCFQCRGGQPGGVQLCQGMACGVLLTCQITGQATVKAQIQFGQMLTGNLRLVHAQW